MGKVKWHINALVIIFILALCSCGKELPIIPPEVPAVSFNTTDTIINGEALLKIDGIINRPLTLSSDTAYLLSGIVYVEADQVLTIDTGCKIYALSDIPSGLVINRKAKIEATASAGDPIVFSSINTLFDSASPGDWVGIHINGQSTINGRSAGLLEYVGKYGRTTGPILDDDSGSFQFVRIEYAGQMAYGTTGALNINGVGSHTIIDHIQTYESNGHGIRIRGGTANLKHLISTQTYGNGIRWDNGWTGKGQYWISHLNASMIDTTTSLRGGSSSSNEMPRSSPMISNITLLGYPNSQTRGLRLRDHTFADISNAIISTTNRGLRVDQFQEFIESEEVHVHHNRIFNNEINYFDNSTSIASAFQDQSYHNSTEAILLDSYVGATSENAFNPKSLDDWFDASEFIGAIQNAENDWTANWSK